VFTFFPFAFFFTRPLKIKNKADNISDPRKICYGPVKVSTARHSSFSFYLFIFFSFVLKSEKCPNNRENVVLNVRVKPNTCFCVIKLYFTLSYVTAYKYTYNIPTHIIYVLTIIHTVKIYCLVVVIILNPLKILVFFSSQYENYSNLITIL